MVSDYFILLDCLLDLPCSRRTQSHPAAINRHDSCSLRFTGPRVRLPSQMGHDWLDGVLHLGHPRELVHPPSVFFLADGRLLLGCYASCTGRIWEEDHRSCKLLALFFTFALYANLHAAYRMKVNSIPGLSHLNRGMITRMSCGTRNQITASAHGFLPRSSKMKAIPNLTPVRYTVEKLSTSPHGAIRLHLVKPG